jgi:hypothetical protein
MTVWVSFGIQLSEAFGCIVDEDGAYGDDSEKAATTTNTLGF